MKPDLLVTWIKHCDYPIFRRFLKEHRQRFGKIIIYWSEHFRHMYYDKFIQADLAPLDNITFINSVDYKYGVEDWRNVSTNLMLGFTESEWVCSVEQDWFCRDWNRLLDMCDDEMKRGTDLFGWYNLTAHSYFHPAFWFIKRSMLDKTTRDFGPHSEIGGSDHFGMVTYDVERLGGKTKALPVGEFKADSFAFHQGGINQNYLEGLKPGYVFHRAEWFYIYNYWSMKAKVKQSDNFMDLMKKIDEILKVQFPDINPEIDERKAFYI